MCIFSDHPTCEQGYIHMHHKSCRVQVLHLQTIFKDLYIISYCSPYNTSPNAPFPIIVNCSKSSIPILRLCSRIYSVSLRSKFLSISCCSSTETWASCALLWSVWRLKQIKMEVNDHVFRNCKRETWCQRGYLSQVSSYFKRQNVK